MASRADGLFHAVHDQLHEPAGVDDRDADERQRGAEGARSSRAERGGQHADPGRITAPSHAGSIQPGSVFSDQRDHASADGISRVLRSGDSFASSGGFRSIPCREDGCDLLFRRKVNIGAGAGAGVGVGGAF